MELKRKAALAAIGVLGLTGVGVGTALAQSNSGPSTTTKATVTSPAAEAPEPAGPDTDNIQQGDQTTPDVAGATEEKEAPESGEKAGVEEPGDENLPGGGHADPEGQNVDHQFEGQE